MEVTINKQKPLVAFALTYNFSKLFIEKFIVPSLEPDKLPVIKVTVKNGNGTKEYKIDTKNSLDDEMELPIFEVNAEFPIQNEPNMTIEQSSQSWIKIELLEGEWITIEYTPKGGLKQVK